MRMASKAEYDEAIKARILDKLLEPNLGSDVRMVAPEPSGESNPVILVMLSQSVSLDDEEADLLIDIWKKRNGR